MPVFEYKAVDRKGRASAGTLTADTAADGRRVLRDSGCQIHAFQPAFSKKSNWRRHLPRWRSSRRNQQVAEFARHLALLLRSGVPITQALEVLIAQAPRGRWPVVLGDLSDRIQSGQSLAQAMQHHGGWFDAMVLSAVRIGEESGSLDKSLAQLGSYLNEKSQLANRVGSALVYPLILLVLGSGVTVFLMVHVIPQLLVVLEASGKPLPAATALLKLLSDALIDWWPVLVLVLILIVIAIGAALRRPKSRRGLEASVLKVPVLGPLIGKTLVARFAQQMNMLLVTGIPFTQAIRTVRAGSRHLILGEELAAIERSVESGSDIAPTLANSRVFPPLVAHLVGVGQDAGQLTEMLTELRISYEGEVNLALTRFTAALEPLLIVIMSAVIGFVIFATVMPILQVSEAMR